MSENAYLRCDGCGQFVHVDDVLVLWDKNLHITFFYCPGCYVHTCGDGEDKVESNVN